MSDLIEQPSALLAAGLTQEEIAILNRERSKAASAAKALEKILDLVKEHYPKCVHRVAVALGGPRRKRRKSPPKVSDSVAPAAT